MNSKIKAIGLAFVATMAMSAIAASAAHAGTLHIAANPSVITATNEAGQKHVATLPDPPDAPFNVPCEEASFEGTAQQGAGGTQTIHEATVTAAFAKCKIASLAATVQMNGCKYTVTGVVGESNPANTFLIDIVGCTAGKQVQVKSAICTLDMPMQNNLSHIVAQKFGNGEITLEAKITGVTEVQTGAACPQGNNAHTTEGSIEGSTIAKAFKDAGTAQATKDSHQYTEHKCGEQVELITT